MEKKNGNINGTPESGIFDRILKYTGVFGGVQCISILVILLLNKIKSIWLGPVCYGITESLNRNTDVIKGATNLGIQTVAVPRVSRDSEANDADRLRETVLVTRSWALLTAIAGMTVCLILAPFLGRWAFGGDGEFTVSFMLMSAAVAAAAVTGGEMAILRGMGLMRQVALSQLLTSVVSLCVSVPLYWWLKLDGIVPVLVLSALGSMIVTCCYSFRYIPYRALPFSHRVLGEGLGMIGFGVFFTVASFLGAWAWSIIAKFLMGKGGSELTGIYSAGYMLVAYFTTMLLSVNDSEYFPRLSAAVNDKCQLHNTVDNQVMAMLMLSAPMVICFIIVMPIVIYVVLEYGKFYSSISLAQMAVVGVFFKSASQPVASIILAKSDQVIYLIQETLCYILLVICVVYGYNLLGIMGVGVALAIWEILYMGIVLIVSKIRYDYLLSSEVVISFLIQAVFVTAVSALSQCKNTAALVVSFVLLVISVVYSYIFFRKHTTFMSGLGDKIHNMFFRN